MFKINIFIGLISMVGGFLNLFLGYKYNAIVYSFFYAVLALIQVFLALAVVTTGASRAQWFFANRMLSKIHVPTAFVFYTYSFFVVVFMVPYMAA